MVMSAILGLSSFFIIADGSFFFSWQRTTHPARSVRTAHRRSSASRGRGGDLGLQALDVLAEREHLGALRDVAEHLVGVEHGVNQLCVLGLLCCHAPCASVGIQLVLALSESENNSREKIEPDAKNGAYRG